MRASLALLALVAVAAPARAQDPNWQRFFPLAVGNEWQYERTQEICFSSGVGGTTCRAYRWVERYAITSSEIRSATVVFDVQLTGTQGAPSGPYSVRLQWYYEANGVKGSFDWPRSVDFSVPTNGYDLNGYHVVTLPPEGFVAGTTGEGKRYLYSKSSSNPNDRSLAFDVVAGVGPVRDGLLPSDPNTDLPAVRVLRYARVGDVEIGQRAVAAEAETGQAAGWAVFPNPARNSATVRLSAPATVELLDALGRSVRRVEAGRGDVPLDLTGLAPGVYAVRAVGETRMLVVR